MVLPEQNDNLLNYLTPLLYISNSLVTIVVNSSDMSRMILILISKLRCAECMSILSGYDVGCRIISTKFVNDEYIDESSMVKWFDCSQNNDLLLFKKSQVLWRKSFVVRLLALLEL